VIPGPTVLERARLHAEICKVLTDPKRLLLLRALRGSDRTVGELAAEIGTSLPNASQHLAVLRTAGLVDGRREGASVRYRLAEPAILDACDIVEGIVVRRLTGRPAAVAAMTPAAIP
jgi:DNA-binding transcriptional ArsR family regulator